PVGHQTSRSHEFTNGIHRRKSLVECPTIDLHPICECQGVADYEQRLRLGFDSIQRGYNVGRQFDFDSSRIESECLSGFYHFSQLKSGISNADITQHAKPSQIGDYLAKEFYPFANKIEVKADRPVALPAGLARLAARPLPTGSVASAKTIGIV